MTFSPCSALFPSYAARPGNRMRSSPDAGRGCLVLETRMELLRDSDRKLCEPLQFDRGVAVSIRALKIEEPSMETPQPPPEPAKRRWPFGYGEEA